MLNTSESYKKNPGHISGKPLWLRLILSIWSLAAGAMVTGRFFFKPHRTVHFPRKVLKNIDSFHGHIEHTGQEDNPAKPRCISCKICAKICPSQCISLSGRENRPDGDTPKDESASKITPRENRTPATFILDFSKCSLCGLCVEACPVNALIFSRNIYLAWNNRDQFKIDLLDRLKNRSSILTASGREDL